METTPFVALLTREYPPDVYGGAGVHVEHLARELRLRLGLTVHCWGEPRLEPDVVARGTIAALGRRTTVVPGGLSKLLTYSLAPLPRWGRSRIMGGIMRGMTRPVLTAVDGR